MTRSTTSTSGLPLSVFASWGVLVIAVTIGSSGCSTGTSLVAASAYRKASVYGTSKAYVRMAPEEVFKPGVVVLAELENVEITGIDDNSTRCTANQGDRVLTYRVFESGTGRSRLSVLVGGGDDADANQDLADRIVQKICERLGAVCE